MGQLREEGGGGGKGDFICSLDDHEGKGNGASIYYMWREEG